MHLQELSPLLHVSHVGAFLLVGYAGRRARDLYLEPRNEATYCYRCRAHLPSAELIEHVWAHAPQRVRAMREAS